MASSLDVGQVEVVRYVRDAVEASVTSVVEENWLEIACNGIHVATLACSPFDVRNLVLGHLFFRKIIEEVRQVKRADVRGVSSDGRIRAEVETHAERVPALRHVTGLMPWASLEADVLSGHARSPLEKTLQLTPSTVVLLMKRLYASAGHYQRSRGIHASALSNGRELLVVAEDLSRHCAADRAIGAALSLGIGPSCRVFVTTGRLSSGLILRAYQAGIEILLSRTSPTLLALKLAAQLGLTVVGYIRADSFTVYSAAERVEA
jgi:FdhD protein